MPNKKTAGSVSWIKREKPRRNIFIALFLIPTMLCFCIFYLYPIITVFFTSFCKWDYTNVTTPELFGLKELFTNYQYITGTYPYFGEAMRNSLLWAAIGIFVQIPISLAVALALARKLRGWKFVRNVYIVPNVISTAAMGMIFLQFYNPRYGVINPIVQMFNPSFTENLLLLPGVNFVAMTCSYLFFTGSTTILILGQIMAIPHELTEAATLDGADGFKRDFEIVIPLIKDTLKTVSVLAATGGFLLYNEVYFLTKGAAGTRSVSYIIRELAIMSSRTQYARANTVGVIQILTGMLIVVGVNALYSIPFDELLHKREEMK